MRRICVPLLILVGGLWSSFMLTQTSTGTLQGLVTDSSGAAIPDAKVNVANESTGVSHDLTTSAEGRYILPLLLPGEYRVTVEKAGFKRFVRSGIRLNVQQNRSIDVELTVGEVATTVDVVGAPPPVETNSSTLATVIESKRISELPLNGRNPFALATLTPGVIPGGGSTPWISGGRNATSEITIDGTSIILPENNVSINTLAYTPSVDAVEEFSVQTNTLAAEYGRSGGGVINVATKQGGNTLHGSGFEFLRNNKLDANNFFSNRAGVPLRTFQRNQFGGTIGGPIFIPKGYDGRNRTFFFVDYQGTRQRQASLFTGTVPLEEWKRGDFSNLRTASGAPITIYDPLTTKPDGQGGFIRDPFQGNRIPENRIDPVARKLMSFFPAPNTTPTNAFTQVNNFLIQGSQANDDDRFDVRLDHVFSPAWRMFGRLSLARSEGVPVNFFGNEGTPSGDGPSETRNRSTSLDTTYTVNPSTIVNLRYGFGRFFNFRLPFSTGFDPTTLGFPGYIKTQAETQNLEFPRFDINGLSSLGQATFTTLRFVPNSHVASGSMTKVLSRHTIKAGMEYRKLLLNFLQLGQPAGQYSFNQQWTQRNPVQASGTEGFGLASLLIGVPSSGSVSHDPTPASASTYWGLYFQDDFRVTNNLTLNLGLRYDVDVPRTERYNRYSFFDIDATSPIAGRVAAFPNLRGAMQFVDADNRRQTPTDKNNWGPRFGFAYKIGNKMVARGAYGIMYSGSALQAAGHTGSAGMEGYRSSTSFITSLDGRTPINFLSNPYPDGFNLPLGSGTGASTNLGLGIGESFFVDYVNPVIQQWNFNLQRELPGNLVVEGGYTASKGNHLIDGEGSMTYNQLPSSFFSLGNSLNDLVANPFFGVITNPNSVLSRSTVTRGQLLRTFPQYTSVNGFRKPQANSIYHAFTLRVERRFSQGLGLLVAYTGGKLIDDASQTVTFLGPAGNKQDFYNRRGERSISTQDVSSRLVTSVVYDLPFGRERRFLSGSNSVVNAVLGGWQINGIVTFQTGTPVILTQTQNNTGLGTAGQRPNNNGTSAEITSGSKGDRVNRWFDTSVFSFASAFAFGNVGRTLPDVRNPGQRNFDLSLFKNFRLSEGKVNLQVRAEAFNTMNTAQFAAPTAQVGNSSNGVISSTAVNPRQVQLALKISF
jgi:Carboxypeptidase regulatory-like domain/TonB dependent receptor